MRYFMLITMSMVACSANGVGLQQNTSPDASVDTWTAQPDTFIQAADTRPSLPCNGACGAGTTCVNNMCVATVGPEAKVGAEPQAGPEPAGKEQGPEPQRNSDAGTVANPDGGRPDALPCVGGGLGQPCCLTGTECTVANLYCSSPVRSSGTCIEPPGTMIEPGPEPNRDGGTPEPRPDSSIPDTTAISPDGGMKPDTQSTCGGLNQPCCHTGIFCPGVDTTGAGLIENPTVHGNVVACTCIAPPTCGGHFNSYSAGNPQLIIAQPCCTASDNPYNPGNLCNMIFGGTCEYTPLKSTYFLHQPNNPDAGTFCYCGSSPGATENTVNLC